MEVMGFDENGVVVGMGFFREFGVWIWDEEVWLFPRFVLVLGWWVYR